MKKIIILSMFVLMMSACSSSGDSSPSGGGSGNYRDITVSGKVVHSAFSASDKVCYDRNNNKRCDDGEPFTLVASDGTYTILGTLADSASVPLLAELANNNTPTNLYNVPALARLETPALVFETPSGQRTIFSITTIIKSAMDNDPSLSLNDVENKMKTSLGTNANLFDPSSEVLTLANKISAAIESMFNKLAADFNITISKNTILLVMNEIIPQLSSIANGSKTPDQVANDTIGSKDQNTINQETDELANSVPVVKTAYDAFKDGLQAYNFENRGGGYRFALYDISTSEMRTFENGDYQSALPTTGSQNMHNQSGIPGNEGSVIYNQSFNVLNVEIIQMAGKSLTSTPRQGSKVINFSTGAVMYKFNAVSAAPVIDLDVIRSNQCPTNTITSFVCGNVTINNNIIEIRLGVGFNFDIVTSDDGKYIVNAKDESSKYYGVVVFSPTLTTQRGTYSKSTDSYGDVYTFKNIDGITVFKVFKMNSQYYLAGVVHKLLTNTSILFDKTAAENIKSQWATN